MEEIFLNTSQPGFKEEEERVKKEGFVEKKFTRSTKKEVEDAFRRHLFKQLVPERGLSTPEQINALRQEINAMIPITLYEVGKNGQEFLKFKMYIPSDKLKKQREKEELNMLNEWNEEFAPENYGEKLHTKRREINSLVRKAAKSVKEAQKAARNTQRHAAFPYGPRNQNVKAVYQGIAPEIAYYANISQKALLEAEKAAEVNNFNAAQKYAQEAYLAGERAKKVSNTPMNMLANMMARTNFGTQWQIKKKPNGALEMYEFPQYAIYNNELNRRLEKMGMRRTNKNKKGGKRKTNKR